jgi:predicted nucleic acid-binding Zn ribbon protein
MPIYVWTCPKCDLTVEDYYPTVIRNEEPVVTCTTCRTRMIRKISAGSFRFDGFVEKSNLGNAIK